MRNLPLVVAALLLSAASAFAQRTDYSIDNFDFRNGVKTAAPAVEASRPLSTKTTKHRSRSALISASNSVPSMPATPLVTPTLLTPGNVSALRGYTTGSSEIDGYLVQSGKSNGVD